MSDYFRSLVNDRAVLIDYLSFVILNCLPESHETYIIKFKFQTFGNNQTRDSHD